MGSKNEKMLEQGSFMELLLKLSLPAMVVILIMIVYNMADTFFIGQTGNPDKISAISVCLPIFTILSGLGTLFGVGGSTAVSISLGEKNTEKIAKISSFCTFGSFVVGIVCGLVVFTFAPAICVLLGANNSILTDAVTYIRVFAFAAPFVIFSNAYGNILRADGGAALAMIANVIGSVSNIVLDALFILGFQWDVFGAALATVIGNVLASVCVVWIMTAKKRIFLPRVKNLTMAPEITVPVLTLGLPMTFSTLLNSVSGALQNRLMLSHGSVSLAAQSVAGKMGMMITMLIMGLCMGMQPAISYNYGSKNYRRMYEVLKKLGLFTVGLGVCLALVVFLGRTRLVAAFIDNEQVIGLGSIFALASVCIAPFYAVYQVCQIFFQSTGKVKFAITSSLLDKGIVYIPVLLAMNAMFGAMGIAFAHLTTMIISLAVTLVMALVWVRAIRELKQE